jgi:hypothetical protein
MAMSITSKPNAAGGNCNPPIGTLCTTSSAPEITMQAMIEKSRPIANAVKDIPELCARDFGSSISLVFTKIIYLKPLTGA